MHLGARIRITDQEHCPVGRWAIGFLDKFAVADGITASAKWLRARIRITETTQAQPIAEAVNLWAKIAVAIFKAARAGEFRTRIGIAGLKQVPV